MARPRRSAAIDPPDAFDLAILRILQQDNLTPQRVIGDRVNLSAPAVQRRVRRMEKEGVIRDNVAVVDPDRIGNALTIVVLVQVQNESIDLIDKAKKGFIDDPNVQQCYYVTGAIDFVLVVSVADMADYERLTRRLFFGNGNVKRFETLIAMDRVKTSLRVPI
jgi:DNA-binding Lrp family transcriptional regulator